MEDIKTKEFSEIRWNLGRAMLEFRHHGFSSKPVVLGKVHMQNSKLIMAGLYTKRTVIANAKLFKREPNQAMHITFTLRSRSRL